MKDDDKEVKKALDELEKVYGSKFLYNLMLAKANKILAIEREKERYAAQAA